MGAFTGFIYLSVIMMRSQTILLPCYICGLLPVSAYSMGQRTVAWEQPCALLVLIYSLIVLQLAHSERIFRPAQPAAVARSDAASRTLCSHAAEMKPLIYLTGAKMLTVLCYFLPFFQLVARAFVGRAAAVPSTNGVNANYTTTITTITHLLVLLFTRLALGTVTIRLHRAYLRRHSVNYLMLINGAVFATLFVVAVPITLFVRRHQIAVIADVRLKGE